MERLRRRCGEGNYDFLIRLGPLGAQDVPD
jgi:hypothetical protein